MPGDHRPADGIIFACARDGLTRTLEQGLLGGYDGAGAWVLAMPNLRGDSEQLMVETHEGLHHELQTSSGLGLVSAMALLLARRGFRPHALAELFQGLANDSTHTHEVFATTCQDAGSSAPWPRSTGYSPTAASASSSTPAPQRRYSGSPSGRAHGRAAEHTHPSANGLRCPTPR